MDRNRLRIRFSKTGDLRLISHRDLARAWERLLRRAQLRLAMSQGFHPHPRINFPSALALGVEGVAEIVEVELDEPVEAEEVHQRLIEHAPPGWVIGEVRALAQGHPKPRVAHMTYELPIPADRCAAVQLAMQRIAATKPFLLSREGRAAPLDLHASLLDWELLPEHRLRFRLAAVEEAQVRPRELLAALGIEDLEADGVWLVRTEVAVTDELLAHTPPENRPASTTHAS